MAPAHPLDRPIWTMLTGRQAHLAEGGDRAKRIDRGYGVFGVAADTGAEAQAALAALVPDDGELWIVEGEPWPVPAGTREVKRAVLAQMVVYFFWPMITMVVVTYFTRSRVEEIQL